jgi:glycosyltransferase involved in cell wall biosynthesis
MNVKSTKYVVITPVRDEESYLRLTVESIIKQSIRPVEYVIVNDGSTDRTGEIIDDYVQRYPWIRSVHREDRGFRKTGGGIIEAFYAGFNNLTCPDWDYMAKLDGDLSFGPDYFEKCFDNFELDPQLGIGGGFLYYVKNDERVMEDCPVFHVRGGAKIYRRACWDAIGGLWVGPSTDTVDEVKGNMLGWKSRSFTDLLIQHHRPTGAAYGLWGGLAKNGRGDYVCGYHPLFMMAKCIARLVRRPYVLGSLALLCGFFSGYLKQIPRVDDPELIRFLRRQQLNRLLGRETIWR